MIKIFGERHTAEYDAAERISQFFEEMWPGISTTPIEEDNIVIRASACILGQQRNEIDVLLVAKLNTNRRFRPNRAIRTRDDVSIKDNFIHIENLVAAGEVKGHSEERVRLSGGEILIKYREKSGWESATRQNVEQVHSLKRYLKNKELNPYICGFIYLSNISEKLGAAINPSMGAQDFFSRVLQNASVTQSANRFHFRSISSEMINDFFRMSLLKERKPSNLDKRKMETLLFESRLVNSVINDPPKKITQFSGVGGTGKTVHLLQLASRFHKEQGERSLFLTFNVPLAAELQRLMMFQNIKSLSEDGGIKIQTVMSFFYTLFARMELSDHDESAEYSFNDYKPMLELVESAIMEGEFDINELVSNNLSEFEFDRIFVDEAQDWHAEEAKILKNIYSDTPIYVADGQQQMVRTMTPARWFEGVLKESRRHEQLKRCLRLKSSLAGFLKSLATKFDDIWDGEISNKASGGQIILNCGDFQLTEIHKSLVTYGKNQNIDNIDWLYLVPPNAILNANLKTTTVSKYLRENGYKVIDLVDQKNRKEMQPEPEMFRVIQYESCRGLEGWITVLYEFDKFLEHKLELSFNVDLSKFYDFEQLDIAAKQFAWNWASMVFSRAMDTIVINIKNPDYGIGRLMVDHCRQNKDIVQFEPSIN